MTQPADAHPVGNETVKKELRRSCRQRRLTIPNYYIVYLQEVDGDNRIKDPLTFKEAIDSVDYEKWLDFVATLDRVSAPNPGSRA